MKKIKERKLHFVLLAFLTGIFLGINISFNLRAVEPVHKYLDYFHRVFQIIRTDFVEKVDNRDIFYGAIKGMIGSLNDPFSRFLDEDAYSELNEETTGKFVGVGIEISVREGEIVVISPIEDTPAMKFGITSGDKIIKVNNNSIKNKSLSEITKLIRGLPGTKVKLTIERQGLEEPLEFTITRVPITIETVKYDIMENTKVGYIKVKTFSTDTQRGIEKALKYFNKQDIDKVIIDLRWNPGGLLDKAISISDYFLKKDTMIVSTRGRKGSGNIRKFQAKHDALYKGKIILLVNKGSASASEILAGAIKDNSRGELVGEKTFGKGSVQKLFKLNENTGVTITIAKYYTPSGISIHGKGIIPDHEVSNNIYSDEEKKTLAVLHRKKIVEQYARNNKEYNQANRKDFARFLKEKGYNLSEEGSNLLLKREQNKYAKQPMYDLEFDRQLVRAIEILNEKS